MVDGDLSSRDLVKTPIVSISPDVTPTAAAQPVVRPQPAPDRADGVLMNRFIGVAIIVLIIAGSAVLAYRRTTANSRDSLLDLARQERWIEARVTGGIPWAPLQSRLARQNTSTLAAIVSRGSTDQQLESRRSAAIAALLLGDAKSATATLAEMVRVAPSATGWSDLAAARYALIVESPAAISDALVAADAALVLDPKLAEALFNRALILERLGTRELALAAWQRYLDVDSASGWAMEAQAHIRALSNPNSDFETVLKREYDRVASGDATAFAPFAQEIRTWGETEILGRWADAEQHGDRAAAERHLAVARTFGNLVRARGDVLLADAVAIIDTADENGRKTLASAHVDFREAQHAFMQVEPARAEKLFARAAENFERTKSPMAILALYFGANTAYEQNRVKEASRALEALLVRTPRHFRSCRAQVQWELALCRSVEGRYGEAIKAASEGRDTFAALGERRNAGTLGLMVAWIHELTGDTTAAWTLRTATLGDVGYSTSNVLLATLGTLGQTAILRKDWRAAASFLALQLESAQSAKSDPFAADARLRRALVHGELGDRAAAYSDLAEAHKIAAGVSDTGIRTQLDSRLAWVEGVVAESPAAQIEALTRAVELHQEQMRRITLPSILYDRARAYRAAGDTASAAADLETAVAELESHRQSLPMGTARWGVFHGAEELFSEAIDLALAGRAVDKAFQYAERARARTLLDALSVPNSLSLKDVPTGTTIVEYVVTPTRLVAFVVDHTAIRVALRPLDRRRLETEIDQLQEAMRIDDAAAAERAGRALHAALIEPVEPWIAGQTNLVIVPDTTVARVAYAALVTRENRYLIEKHALVIAPSAAVFTHAPRPPATALPRRPLIVVNDTAEGRDPLVGATQEAAGVERVYGRATILRRREATPDAFIAAAANADIIHFSGHALTSELRAKETFLVLQGPEGHEKRLDVEQIASIPLSRAPVVVLAACSTARGRVSPLEGTMSAAHAFLAAGATSVAATLWPIDDRESGRFFVRVHEHLARGETAADAIRTSQIEWSRTSRSPKVWAAVQVIGN